MRLLSPMPILAMSTVLALAVLPQVCPADEKREEEPRMKGVELYSWNDKEGDWMFVLLDGTNRVKTEKEVKEAKTKVKDIDALKRAIATLAVMLGSGADLPQAMQIANRAAGIVVGKLGTAVVTRQELENA